MSAKKTDISQIRKYLDGELDARAMHQLEREAQDDPFLADALEGYEQAGKDMQPQLTDLDRMLRQRIDQSKVRRLIPWKYYAAAASILIVFTLGYLFWPAKQLPKPQQTALVIPETDHPVTKTDTVSPPPVEEKMAKVTPPAEVRKAGQTQIAPASPQPAASAAAMQAAVPVSADKNTTYKADTVQYRASAYKVRQKPIGDSTGEILVKAYGQKKADPAAITGRVNDQMLQSKVAGVTVPISIVRGIVSDEIGRPLPNALVREIGKPNGAQTDATGRFSLTAADNASLSVNAIGYEVRQIKADAKDSMNVILQPANRSLSEVVVTTFGRTGNTIKEAHPLMGWDAYKKYLKDHTSVPGDDAGTVHLSFTIDSKGQMSDFKVIKGLTDILNQQAIKLVKEGPPWAPDMGGQAKVIKLDVDFRKQK